MKPYLSIIIPTLNEEKFIPNLLNSLKKQRAKNFEVVVVDGKSDDQTKNRVLDYKKSLPLKFFQVEKRNVSYQRNYGAKKARGEYLVFLDADSKINVFFTYSLEKIIKKKKGLIFIPYIVPDESNSETKLIFNFINFLLEIAISIGNKGISSGGCIFFEKNFFEKIGGFDDRLFISEDHELVDRALKWGVRAKFLKEIKIKFSLRRMRKEGRLKLYFKYLQALTFYLINGKIQNKIFDYEMGGQLYFKESKKISPGKAIKRYLIKAEKFFDKLF
ncbi:MAG: glycosyltransferase [Microgenomates group bacterium]|nr:glycosyltransferase [Microgenomates group bacterium]